MTKMEDFIPNYPKSENPPCEPPEPKPEEKKPTPPIDDKNSKKSKPTECDEEKKYKCFPREIREYFRTKKGKSGLFIYDTHVFDKFDWSEMKRLNIEENEKEIKNAKGDITGIEFKNPPTIVLFPNMKGRAYIKGMIGENASNTKKIPFLVKMRDSSEPKDVIWLDEVIDKKKITKILIDEEFLSYIGSINSQPAIFYTNEELKENIYDIEAVYMPLAMSTSEGTNIISNRYLITKKTQFIEDFKDVADKKFPNIQSISPVWDYRRDSPIYDDVETFIILSSAIFMIPYFPAIGLILCGGTRARKTAWLESFKEIFNDYVIVMNQQASEKGLLVTHHGDKPMTGLVFNSRFVTLLDEFMRAMYKGADKEGRTQALLKNCSDYMNVIEHKEFPYSSGKGTVFATLKSSFIATDNTVFRSELQKAWQDDSASLRRFTFLKVSKETEERAMNLSHVNSREIPLLMTQKFFNNKTFTTLGEYAKFFRFGRHAISRITLTPEEQTYLENLWYELARKYNAKFPIRDSIEALFMCYKFWQQHVECMPIKLFEDAVERIFSSHKELLEPDLTDWKKNVGRTTSIDVEEKQLAVNDDFSKA